MTRILILVAIALFSWSAARAFQGGGGEATKKGSIKKAVTTGLNAGKTKKSATPATKSNLPKWITQLSNNPILPGIGLAGIQVGYSERTVLAALGTPPETLPVKTDKGELLFYALQYRYEGLFLGVYTSRDARKVQSIRLYDDNFNRQAHIPRTDSGATIGISAIHLQQILGEPAKTDKHLTCPRTLGNVGATTVHYAGISFWVCDANKLVYLVDIR